MRIKTWRFHCITVSNARSIASICTFVVCPFFLKFAHSLAFSLLFRNARLGYRCIVERRTSPETNATKVNPFDNCRRGNVAMKSKKNSEASVSALFRITRIASAVIVSSDEAIENCNIFFKSWHSFTTTFFLFPVSISFRNSHRSVGNRN